MEALWPAATFGIIAGEEGCNKTMLTCDLALAVAAGGLFLGRACVRGPVLMISAEDEPETMSSRLWRFAEGRGLDLRTLDIRIVAETALWLDDPLEWERVCAAAEEMRPRLITLDPLRLLTFAEERDSTAMVVVLRRLRDLVRRAGCSVALVHHFRKRAESDRGGRTAQRIRGSGGLAAHARVAWLVHRVDREARRLEVELRAAPAPADIPWRVEGSPPGPLRLAVTDEAEEARTVEAKVLAALAAGPRCVADLRRAVGGRACDVDDARQRLREADPPVTVERRVGKRVMVALADLVPNDRDKQDKQDKEGAAGTAECSLSRVPPFRGDTMDKELPSCEKSCPPTCPTPGHVGTSCPPEPPPGGWTRAELKAAIHDADARDDAAEVGRLLGVELALGFASWGRPPSGPPGDGGPRAGPAPGPSAQVPLRALGLWGDLDKS